MSRCGVVNENQEFNIRGRPNKRKSERGKIINGSNTTEHLTNIHFELFICTRLVLDWIFKQFQSIWIDDIF